MPKSECKLAEVLSLLCTCGESRLGKTLSLGSLCCLYYYYYCLGVALLSAWSLCPQPRGGIISVRGPGPNVYTGPWWQQRPTA